MGEAEYFTHERDTSDPTLAILTFILNIYNCHPFEYT